MSAAAGYLGCDLCLASIDGQITQVQYSPGAFVYGETQVRVTPERRRLRDVQVCAECSTHLRMLVTRLIEQRGRPARQTPGRASG